MKEQDDWHLTEAITHALGRGDPFAAAVRATRMPMVITDPAQPDNPIVFCNQAFQSLTGYAREEVIGRNCRFLQGPDSDPATVKAIGQAIADGRDIAVDLLNYRKDGSTFWNALYLSPVRNDDGSIQYFFASQLDVTERVEAQATITAQKEVIEREVALRTADLKEALEVKTLLLHEVDHRVKNNLTMIGSLLRLQARSIADPQITEKLENMLQRIDALATVHRRLYESDDLSHFDVGAFAANLVSDVVGASGRTDLRVTCDVDHVEIPSESATAVGLVLNEILTNAIKHAFSDGRAGTLDVSVKRIGDRAMIRIKDDGPGLGGAQPPSEGLGFVLIKRLSRQIGASIDWPEQPLGTLVELSFPVSG
ncbi:PAS domain-containing protein [Tsuneonella rigui]|uniref:PAS domain-containing protein n=1 Tax=Tsuneonella rigui TaxID=1708790 RepID=UPI000F7E5DC6|nr:PAS domain-containing protein [Tsuneonella rigui]